VVVKLVPDQALIEQFTEPHVAFPLVRIECHYFVNDCFVETHNYLIENSERSRDLPAVTVPESSITSALVHATDRFRKLTPSNMRWPRPSDRAATPHLFQSL
jgi:hypothetical protein